MIIKFEYMKTYGFGQKITYKWKINNFLFPLKVKENCSLSENQLPVE